MECVVGPTGTCLQNRQYIVLYHLLVEYVAHLGKVAHWWQLKFFVKSNILRDEDNTIFNIDQVTCFCFGEIPMKIPHVNACYACCLFCQSSFQSQRTVSFDDFGTYKYAYVTNSWFCSECFMTSPASVALGRVQP